MTTTDEEITELYDLSADNGVHGVRAPANGRTFFLIKGIDGEEVAEPTLEMVKSSDAFAAFVKGDLSLEDAQTVYSIWCKAKYKQADRDKMASNGQAMSDGAYPIKDAEDLNNAIHAVGHGGASHDAIRKHVMARAKALGLSSKIPDNWNADGSLQKAAKSATCGGSGKIRDGNMDCPDCDGPVSKDTGTSDGGMAGSPEWESDDADMAMAVSAQLAQAIQMLGCSIDRETQEVSVGVSDDIVNVWQLEDALCMIQTALGTVAAFAFGEQAQGVSKSLDIAKMSNETRETVAKLTQLLDSMSGSEPTAPEAPSDAELRKEEDMPLTAEDLAAIGNLVNKTIEDREIAKTQATEAEKAAADELAKARALVAKADADATAAAAAPAPAPASSGETAAGLPPEIADVLKGLGGLGEQLSAFNTNMGAFLGAPAPGGPQLSTPPAPDGGPRGAGASSTAPLPPEIAQLQSMIKSQEGILATAHPESPVYGNAERLVKELRGRLAKDIMREVYRLRGYDDTQQRRQRWSPVGASGASLGVSPVAAAAAALGVAPANAAGLKTE